MRQLLFYFLLFFAILPVHSQSLVLSDSAKVSVITCGKGNELYSLYGHTALRIYDPLLRIDRVYNYGMFDFRTKNFGLKFVKGDLQYFVGTSSFEEFLSDYEYDKRSVFEQVIAIPQDKKQTLFEKLTRSLRAPEKFYTYKFIDRNCTTKVVDLLNEALGQTVIKKVGNTDISYRAIIYPKFDGHFYEQWGSSLFFGTKVDQKAEKIFLPLELWESINEATYNGKPLLVENKSLLVFEDQPLPLSVWNNVYTYVLLLLLLVFLGKEKAVMIYFALLAVLGTFFCLSGWYSYHEELKWDYNVLLINPLLLAVVISYVKRNAQAVFMSSAICLLCLIIYLGYMLNKIHLVILLPMIVANAILLCKLALKARANKLFQTT